MGEVSDKVRADCLEVDKEMLVEALTDIASQSECVWSRELATTYLAKWGAKW